MEVKVIAHRGASAYAPENLLSAFSRAKDLGLTWIEFDVMLAACGEVVVFHDDDLNRTTNGKGLLSSYPYSHLKTLDAGSWFAPEFKDEKIPTFKEVIGFFAQHQLSANIEIKAVPGKEEETVKKVINLIQSEWTPEMPPPLISSFSVPILQYVRQHFPEAHLGLLMKTWWEGWEQTSIELKCELITVSDLIIDPEKIKQIHAMNKLVLCFTINNPGRAQELFSWGVDAVFSDCPDKILAVLSAASASSGR